MSGKNRLRIKSYTSEFQLSSLHVAQNQNQRFPVLCFLSVTYTPMSLLPHVQPSHLPTFYLVILPHQVALNRYVLVIQRVHQRPSASMLESLLGMPTLRPHSRCSESNVLTLT